MAATKELTYCDLLESDDYYVGDKHVFQSQVFATQNPGKYAYEQSINPRDKSTYRSTPNGRYWKSVWDKIDQCQRRAEGKRRNRYHILWQSKRIEVPARSEKVVKTAEKVNPLSPDGPKLVFEYYETKETPPVFAPVELLYFDIDDMAEIEAFKSLPNALWARSPSGRCHVFVLIHPCDYERARDRVAEWMYHNNVRAENNIVRKGGKTLNSILVPGQDEWTLPCKPGKPGESLVNDYQETMALFADHYQNNRLDIDAAFPFSREISVPVGIHEIETKNQPASKPEAETPTPIRRPKRNRPRLGGLCNIPGIAGALRITRNKGATDEETFEYRTVEDCQDESNGFHVGWSYFAALTRKHRGDTDEAFAEFVSTRQSLRTENSKKNNDEFLRQHARAMKSYADRTYEPTKLRHSDRDTEDAKAMATVNVIDPHHYATVIQQILRDHKTCIVEQHGERAYQASQSCVHALTGDIKRNNGRVSQRSRKSREDYVLGDSRSVIDYPGIDGNKHLAGVVIKILRQYVLTVSDSHNWSEAKCTRWTYQSHVITKAKTRAGNVKSKTGNTRERVLSLTKLEPRMPDWHKPKQPEPVECQLFGAIDDILSDLGEKLREPNQS